MKKMIGLLSVVGVLAMSLGLTGCSSNEKEKPKTEPTIEKEKKKNTVSYIPTEVMSVEETNALIEEQVILPEDLTKIPDMEALESRDLTFIYCYDYSVAEVTDPNTYYNPVAYGTPLKDDELHTKDTISGASGMYKMDHVFTGIRILPIINYFLEEDGSWTKFASYSNLGVDTGPVLSQEKINELNNQ